MNILPQDYKQFKDKKYWDHFFSSLKNTSNQYFQWYGSYPDYSHLLQILIPQYSTLFHVGCGKSTFTESLLFHNPTLQIINCDYSENVIGEMKVRADHMGIKMGYEVCDLFEELDGKFVGGFQVVLDKGTLDAMLPEDTVGNVGRIKDGYFNNIGKSLKKGTPGCKIIIISLLQPFVLRTILEYYGFQPQKYTIDIYECLTKDSKLQPFLICIQLVAVSKQKQKQKQKDKFVRFHSLNKEISRWGSIEEVMAGVERIQKEVTHGGRVKELSAGRRTKFNIYSQQNRKDIRYLLEILDSDNKQILQKNTCSIFIVPQGKQTSYLFNDETGLKSLHAQIKTSRLILVKLVAGNQFPSLEHVKKELNAVMPDFVQNGCDPAKAAYMTDADQLGNRKYLYQNEEFIVDEVVVAGEPIRRLFLKVNPTVPQCQFKLTYMSEANNKNLKDIGSKILPVKKNMVTGIDRQQLFDDSARFIYSGLKAFFGHPKNGWKILIFGCQLALAKYLIELHQTVEIVLLCGHFKTSKQVIYKYIEIEQTERFQIHELTPVEYFSKNPQQKFNIIIDCTNERNNDQNPPAQNISNGFQKTIASFLEQPGLYVCQYRDYDSMTNFLGNFFPVYGSQSGTIEDNILFCLTHPVKRIEQKIIVHQNLINFKPRVKPQHEWEADNFKDIVLLQPNPKNQLAIFLDKQSQFVDIYANIDSQKSQKKANKKKKKKR